ncbi:MULTISPECIES: response regulator transcription factor [unclassified Paenibacillus]|uniref:response regulator transcription factor n=1 Tax=unclassified Paenibacillus TaxID=185978 RepID=UPI001C11C6EB|nr:MULTISPECIES: response regulator transcription factor [unclassified Paenibacillus]MBU5442910.1 response regulator transcription factor [Paenibacillus sp. MSJ-34]CAH0119543.1 Transcriptional regulatory protein SrrA [Paenibacillus sp. CECT 9249]
MEKEKILVVDDEWNLRNLLRIYLTKGGYQVAEAGHGSDALKLLSEQSFHLIILDVMMPDMDGWTLCGKIRESSQVPILMLTARTDTRDKVFGLELGADDYLVKPFEAAELLARVTALLRRSKTPYSPEHEVYIRFRNLQISPESREVEINGQKIDFTPKEFDLLLVLAKNPQRVFSRDMLLELLWNYDYTGDARSVDTHIKNIRDKAQKAGLGYNPVQTVWGVGYRFYHPGELP